MASRESLGLALLVVCTSHALAQDARYCSPFDAARQATNTLALRAVKSDVKQLHFLDNGLHKPNCPSAEASCQLPSFLVGGDKLLVSSADAKRIACVHYFSASGKLTSGFVDAGSLTNPAPPSEEKLNSSSGFGTWSNGNTGVIEIKPGSDDYVAITGDINRGPPSYNSGSLNGPAFLSNADDGRSAGYTDEHYDGSAAPTVPADANAASYTCKARLRLVGAFLVVDDNDHCGGNGVMFTGLYKKKP